MQCFNGPPLSLRPTPVSSAIGAFGFHEHLLYCKPPRYAARLTHCDLSLQDHYPPWTCSSLGSGRWCSRSIPDSANSVLCFFQMMSRETTVALPTEWVFNPGKTQYKHTNKMSASHALISPAWQEGTSRVTPGSHHPMLQYKALKTNIHPYKSASRKNN